MSHFLSVRVSERDSPESRDLGHANTVVWRSGGDSGMFRGGRVRIRLYEEEPRDPWWDPSPVHCTPRPARRFIAVQGTQFPADGWGGAKVSMFMHLAAYPQIGWYFPDLRMTPQGLIAEDGKAPMCYMYLSTWIGPSRLWDIARSQASWDRLVGMVS